LCLAQGDLSQQTRITELALREIKRIFPSLPSEIKDFVSLKKASSGDGDWANLKELPGWVVDTANGTLRLSSSRRAELLSLLDIPPTQRQMSRKKLEWLIGKLHSMHLAVPGAIAFFCYLQRSIRLSAGKLTARLTPQFYDDIAVWRALVEGMDSRPSSLAKLVSREVSDVGYMDASGLGGGSWKE
jgi:hypothetical protein